MLGFAGAIRPVGPVSENHRSPGRIRPDSVVKHTLRRARMVFYVPLAGITDMARNDPSKCNSERPADPIKAEAESVVETFNDAKPDHAPKLSWFGMTALRSGGEVREGFVFDTGEYVDPKGWNALREQDREIEYVETYEKCDGTPQISIVLAVEGADTDKNDQ